MAKKFRRNYLCLNSTDLIPRKSQHLFTLKTAFEPLHYKEQIVSPNEIESERVNKICDSFLDLNESDKIDSLSLTPLNQSTHHCVTEGLDIKNEFIDQKFQICLSIYKLYIKNKMTKTCINDVINLIRILRSDVKIPSSIDKIVLYLSKNKNNQIGFQQYDFCNSCKKTLKASNNSTQKCISCLIDMSKFYHIKILDQLKIIFESSDHLINKSSITESEIYSKIKLQEKGEFYTFTLNTDGISPFKSSKTSIWPIYLVLNEFNIKYRFSFSNIILAGIFVGPNKPCFLNYLRPIVDEIKSLEKGEIIKIKNELRLVKFFLTFAVVDKPARASLLNLQQFNGNYGCTKCYQKGQNIPTKKNGTVHVYPYQNYNFEGPLRSHKSYLKDLIHVETKHKAFRGVKGSCILDELKYFFPIEGTMIDYMHSILEGVIRKLLEYWFSPGYSKQTFSLRPYLEKINENFHKIRVPKFVPRIPRDLNSSKYWKASEFLSFILFYALPIFRGIMNLDQLNHLINLVIVIENLLIKQVNTIHLEDIRILLKDFVRDMSKFYGPNSMLSGIHELLHLVRDIRNIGNLNEFNCFPYENLNRELLLLVNGKNLIGIEIINSFKTFKNINLIKDLSLESLKEKKEFKYFFGKKINRHLSEKELKVFKNIEIDNYTIHSYCKYNNIFYSSLCYKKTKRLDHCVRHIKKFGLIKFFIKTNEQSFALCYLLSALHNPFFNQKFPYLKSSTTICHQTDNIFLVPIDQLQKCALVNSNDVIYVCEMNTSHIFN